MLKRILFSKSQRGLLQLIRYGMVVAVAAPIDLGGYILLNSQFHMNAVLAAVIAFTVSLFFNYLLSVKWVWVSHNKREKHIDAMLFGLIGLVGLVLTAVLVWLFTEVAHLHYIPAKLITFLFVFVWSFGARRYLFTGLLLKRTPRDI